MQFFALIALQVLAVIALKVPAFTSIFLWGLVGVIGLIQVLAGAIGIFATINKQTQQTVSTAPRFKR